MVGEKKTRAMAKCMEARGFKTAILERRFDESLRITPEDPQVALFGVDNALARHAIGSAGFKLVVEAGLGSGAKDFRAIRIHTFPGPKDPRELWTLDAQREINTKPRAYDNVKSRGVDQCGVTLLAGRAIGAPFVGMAAATICLSEILRLLHGEQLFGVHELDLKAPTKRACIPQRTKLMEFNPGFTVAL
jgi:hypothetical protein